VDQGNMQFKGSGRQLFIDVFIHLIIFGSLTFGVYIPWAFVRIFRFKAANMEIDGKSVEFVGTGQELFVLCLRCFILCIITIGFYLPWAFCGFFTWKAQNTLVDSRACRFTGTGSSLFLLCFIHLLFFPLITFGMYSIYGWYRMMAWKEEHTLYVGEKTSFGGSFSGFLKVSVPGCFLSIITLGLFSPWFISSLFQWQVNALVTDDDEGIEHFPYVENNYMAITALLVIGLIAGMGLYQAKNRVWSQSFKVAVRITEPCQDQSQLKNNNGVIDTPVSQIDLEYTSKLKTLNNMLAGNNRNIYALYRRAQLYANNGELDKAISDYSRIIAIDQDINSYFNRGLLFMKQKKFDMAIIDFSQVIKMKPESIDALSNRGSAYLYIDKLDLALNDYCTALEIDEKDSDLYFNRGIIYLLMKEINQAEEDFNRAAIMGNSMAREYLGREE